MGGSSQQEELAQKDMEEREDDEPIPASEARPVLETQVQMFRRMNDELLRTTRLHVVLGGGIVTVISVVNADLFRPNSDPLMWLLGFSLASLSFIAWYNHLGASRLSYSDLSIGVHNDISAFTSVSDDTLETRLGRLRKALGRVPYALSTFIGGQMTVDDFESQVDRETAVTQMLSEDYSSAIEQNAWLITTRERYLNAIQTYLYGAFLLLLTGIGIMVVA